MGQSFLFFFVILAACAAIGSTLHCFDMQFELQNMQSSHDDPFKKNTATTRVCRPEEVCLKQITPKIEYGGETVPSVIIRRCTPKTHCDNIASQILGDCYTCSDDLCNSTVKVIPSLSTIIVLYIIKLFFRYM